MNIGSRRAGYKTPVDELNAFGQSVWLDNISRSMIKSGKLDKMIESGLRGMTSNPTIFDKSISSSPDYDEEIAQLSEKNKTTFEIYDELTVRDIQDAADIFLPVYEKSGRFDGYVSLEINPELADKPDETIKEGKRLFLKVGRPNVMFKVPATEAGFKAIEELTAEGTNINATLIFSFEQYINTAEAYLRGIRRFLKNNEDAGRIHSVASVFVSRIDTHVDKLLGEGKNDPLKGKAAVANCALIYEKYSQIFSSADFTGLRKKGANIQRVLWGSTSTKNPVYSDIKYVTELIALNTVNTMPEQTFDAFLDHGRVKEALTKDASGSRKVIEALKQYGIDIDAICRVLLKDGVAAFEKSFDSLLNSLEQKKKTLCNR